MNNPVRKQYFLTAAEFLLCCAAAGIESVPCFADLGDVPEDRTEAVYAMVSRGLLTAEGDGFTLCPALSAVFRAVKDSRAVVTVGYQRFGLPHSLLYGTKEHLVLVSPGRSETEYAGFTLYETDGPADWLEDVRLVLSGSIPDDLLEAVSEEEREADLAQKPEVEEFLLRYAQPGNTEWPEAVPEEVIGCVECVRLGEMLPVGRLLLVRLPLYDHLIVGTESGVRAEIYRAGRAAEAILEMLLGGE